MSLAAPFAETVPDLFTYTWPGREPSGQYVFFLAAVRAGALAHGVLNPGDLVGLSTVAFTVAR